MKLNIVAGTSNGISIIPLDTPRLRSPNLTVN
jgi:hypothetical protein